MGDVAILRSAQWPEIDGTIFVERFYGTFLYKYFPDERLCQEFHQACSYAEKDHKTIYAPSQSTQEA